MFLFCVGSFRKRILITDKSTRKQLASFAKRKFSSYEYMQLKQLIETHAPLFEPLLCYLYEHFEKPEYRGKWMKFLASISSVSPACVLIPPTTEVQELMNLIFTNQCVTSNPEVCYYV